MKIFFAASIRGGRDNQNIYKKIEFILSSLGDLISSHVADHTITDFGETELRDQEIHQREIENLKKADVVVADVSHPSLGVGFQIATALAEGKRVIAVHKEEESEKLSAMISGSDKIEIVEYSTIESLESILKDKLI